MDAELAKKFIGTAVRHALTAGGAALLAAHPGMLTEAQLEATVGGLSLLVAGLLWSGLEKARRPGRKRRRH